MLMIKLSLFLLSSRDVVDLQVRKKKRSYCEATVIRFISKSAVREEPMCEHFGICGGCKWQNLPYSEQLKAKQQQVYDQLSRIGKVELPEFHPIMGSVHTKEYRNKLEFGCANKRWYTVEELQALPEASACRKVPSASISQELSTRSILLRNAG